MACDHREQQACNHASVQEMTARERRENPRPHPAFKAFAATIAALRAPDGCPWDREQTHESIAHNMLEEAYEAVDAIEAGDMDHLREELGDVLLQVVLQSQIAEDAGEFTIDDVCRDIDAKMIRRHPHVFGEAHADSANEVLDLWDSVKLAERADDASEAERKPAGLLEGVPTSFPALMQAQKLSRKVVAVGFDWGTLDEVRAKVREEVAEFEEAYAQAVCDEHGVIDGGADERAKQHVEEEFGDVLFTMVQIARRTGLDAESALRGACAKFRRRWAAVERAAAEEGLAIEEVGQERLEEFWQAVKRTESE